MEVKTQGTLSDKTAAAIRKQKNLKTHRLVHRCLHLPVVLGVREKGGDVEHDLVALKVGVHAVQARRVVCEVKLSQMRMKMRPRKARGVLGAV